MRQIPGITQFGAALLCSARPALVFADRNGYIGFWNAGAEQLFGHSAAEAVGQRVDLIVPASLREAHWSGFNRALASSDWPGSAEWGPVPALHRNGAEIALEVFLTPIAGQEGAIAGVLALFRPSV